jgi:hypothetical protein
LLRLGGRVTAVRRCCSCTAVLRLRGCVAAELPCKVVSSL